MERISYCMGALLQHQQNLHRIVTSFKRTADCAFRVRTTTFLLETCCLSWMHGDNIRLRSC